MRILLLNSSSDLYGSSKVFLQTVQILQKNQHECIVMISEEGPLSIQLKESGIKTIILNLGILRRKYFNPLGLLNRISKWRKAIKAITTIIEQEKIEIVYSNTLAVLVGGYTVHQINKKRKQTNTDLLRHIWHVHEIIDSPNFLYKIMGWCLKKWAHQIIAVSNAVKNHWKGGDEVFNSDTEYNNADTEYNNADTEYNNTDTENNNTDTEHNQKIIRIYNGVEPLAVSSKPSYRIKYNIPTNAIVIGMAGRVHNGKGQIYFLEMAKTLLANEKMDVTPIPLYFIISGDAFIGNEYLVDALQAFIQQNELSNRVFYTGFEKEMDCFYRSIDLLVLPSQLPDSFPTVILEAMQYGKPVVATAQGGALEMIDANMEKQMGAQEQKIGTQEHEIGSHEQKIGTGLFIPLHDVETSAQKIRSLFPIALRMEMGKNAKIKVTQFFSAQSYETNILNLIAIHE